MTEQPTTTADDAAPRAPVDTHAAASADDEAPLPYRLLTGTDDRAFCEKVSAALDDGYVLHGSPSITWDGRQVVTAQAVVLP